MMGAAAVIIPGGNDGLLLSGMPALAPHAWVGLLSMLISMLVSLALMPIDNGFFHWREILNDCPTQPCLQRSSCYLTLMPALPYTTSYWLKQA